jgi:hypothetical protein
MQEMYTCSDYAPEFSGKSLQEIRRTYPEAENKELARAEALLEATRKGRPVIYGEGDSWFDFPGWIILNRCSDILDALLFEHEYCVHRDSYRGDTINAMTFPDNLAHVKSRIQGLKPRVFLISGGGNDLFTADRGSAFDRMLRDDSPDDPIDLSLMNGEIELISQQIRTLAGIAEAEGVPSIIHGYGVPPRRVLGRAAVPFLAGPWINPVLRRKGYNKEQGEEILRTLVSAFNSRLSRMASQSELIEYIDLQGAVEPNNFWHDELHLWAPGWRECGNAFNDVIKRLL